MGAVSGSSKCVQWVWVGLVGGCSGWLWVKWEGKVYGCCE